MTRFRTFIDIFEQFKKNKHYTVRTHSNMDFNMDFKIPNTLFADGAYSIESPYFVILEAAGDKSSSSE